MKNIRFGQGKKGQAFPILNQLEKHEADSLLFLRKYEFQGQWQVF